MKLTYDISDIRPYINWPYFDYAWSMSGKQGEEKDRLRADAEAMLDAWEGRYHTHALFRLLDANSDGDDLLIYGSNGDKGSLVERRSPLDSRAYQARHTLTRIPLLRQQHPSAPGAPCLCLADFVRPLSQGIKDRVGIFCTTVDASIEHDYQGDVYQRMLSQTLADRLAEGTAERMHLEVRRRYWGYAPDEDLSMADIHAEHYQGIRPAIGYPSLPDTSVNFVLNDLLDMKQVGIRLTESGMMQPHASVSGLMFAHPKAHYFDLGKIGEDQLRDYARRRGIPVEMMRRFLQSSILRKP